MNAALLAYRLGASCLAPAAPLWLRHRARAGKEDPRRLRERYGFASRARPEGEFVWAHGASIGETLSLLPVIEALVARGLKVLVTSGTVTAAEVLARRLPPGARHQFAPLDAPRFVRRFLDHWQPRLALFAESELWPNTVEALASRHVPLVLVNARMSERSFERWRRVPNIAQALLGRLSVCVAQSRADADRLAALGAPVAAISGNLKFDLPPPPADPGAVEQLAGLVAGRDIWLAASTHPGEEEAVIAAHRAISPERLSLVTIVAPRHPARADAVVAAAEAAGLAAARRSERSRPSRDIDLYVVDTVGELGLFYRLSPLVFVGGSLAAHGGQNPIEPARLGAAILHGPHTSNFTEAYAALDERGGALRVSDAAALQSTVKQLLGDAAQMRNMARHAAETVNALGGALERTLAAIELYLPPPGKPGEALW